MLRRKKKETQDEAAGFAGEGALPERRRLTPTDVQEKVFRLSFRGYNEQDVDRFLDEVTEELASLHEENKRLRERAEDSGGMASSEILKEAERRAGETVRQAREYAARLMEDAGKRSTESGSTGAAPPPPPTSFLRRERDFLQKLASLIQEHAEAMKAQARGRMADTPKVVSPEPSPAPMATPMAPPTAKEPVAPPPPAPMAETGGPSETTQAHEPFLDDWEETFSGGSEEQPFAGTSSDLFPDRAESGSEKRGKDREEEPSLRELFWGEE
jgi:DivIVA domain-containing protein